MEVIHATSVERRVILPVNVGPLGVGVVAAEVVEDHQVGGNKREKNDKIWLDLIKENSGSYGSRSFKLFNIIFTSTPPHFKCEPLLSIALNQFSLSPSQF